MSPSSIAASFTAASSPDPIPQPRLFPLVGNVLAIDKERPVQSLMRLAREHGPIYRMALPGRTMLVVSSHALVRELSDEARFDKKLHGPLENVRDFAGQGLFTARTDEPEWGKAHRLLTPAFGPLAMRGYFEPMLDLADQLVDKWARLGPEADLDVPDNMTRLTLDTIALCGFDYRFNSFYQRELHPFVDAMVRSLEEAGARTRRLSLQSRLMLLTQARHHRDVAFMNEVVDQVIRERKASPQASEQRDLLGLMLNAVDPVTGERLSDVNIREQIITFLIAGHETTSGLLSFAIYNLLKHPEVMKRATAEVDQVLGAARPTFEHLRKLTYLDQVLRESLRIWPTAPAYAVTPREDTTLAGRYPLQKGDMLLVLIPELHRDPAIWPDPERFDPDRFAPERAAAIPPHAWKPFGNGQRACIGRQFALQEATLVLAMLLRRFELRDPGVYQLEVKETLTLKPDHLIIRARQRQPAASFAAAPAASAPAVHAAHAPSAAAQHGTPLLVLYGSNTGAAESFARHLARAAEAQGYAAEVAPLDTRVGKLPTTGGVLLVSASYNGLPPDNARAFHAWLQDLPAGALQGVRFGVFGCGNRDWATTYQAVPTQLDAWMEAAGAARLLPRGEADGRGDFFGDFEAWCDGAWLTLNDAFEVEAAEVEAGPRYSLERLPALEDLLLATHDVARAAVLSSRELVDLSSPLGRSKRAIALQLPDGMTYQPGDHLLVLPENDPERVARVAARFGLDLDAQLIVRQTRDEATPLPVNRAITVRALLTHAVELAQPVTRSALRQLAAHTPCPPERQRLLALADAADGGEDLYTAEVLDKRLSLLDLLERFASCALPFEVFLELAPPLRPRRYSISSSPLPDPQRCLLTVAVVDAPAWSGQGRFLGTASGYLARVEAGGSVAVAVRPPHAPFALPDDPALPVVMIAAGTGLAPFRGFVEERAARQAAGVTLGPALLFFGCDHPEVDWLYREELAAWERAGVVEVHAAFSQAPEGEIAFVQHRLLAEQARVAALVQQDARFYVCGDGRAMAPAARSALLTIIAAARGCTPAEAEAWLQLRYAADVFGG